MRLIALLAGLAGLAALAAQAGAVGVTAFQPSLADYAPVILQVGRWAQVAFILLISTFLFLFALSKRSA